MRGTINIQYVLNDNGVYEAWVQEYPSITASGKDLTTVQQQLIYDLKVMLNFFIKSIDNSTVKVTATDLTETLKAARDAKLKEENTTQELKEPSFEPKSNKSSKEKVKA